MRKLIYCIRHGQTDYNKNGIVQGSGVDSDLNDMGRLQAAQFYDYYNQKVDFDLVIHSKLKRTAQTVSPWSNGKSKVISDARINEMSWGDAEGKKGTNESIDYYKSIVESWQRGEFDIGIKNGETANDLQKRIVSFVENLRTLPHEKILVCSHGRAMRALVCILNGESISQMEKYNISNVGLYKFEQEGENFLLLSINDTAHRTPI